MKTEKEIIEVIKTLNKERQGYSKSYRASFNKVISYLKWVIDQEEKEYEFE